MKLASSHSQEEANNSHLHALLDVFEVFLDTDNPLVFSNAAADCILCLLKHVRGPSKLNLFEICCRIDEAFLKISDKRQIQFSIAVGHRLLFSIAGRLQTCLERVCDYSIIA